MAEQLGLAVWCVRGICAVAVFLGLIALLAQRGYKTRP
jgi:hypothetical protein